MASTSPDEPNSPASPSGEPPTETLLAGAVGDRCVNCGSPLSADQRYCVVCGERRGAARFTLASTGAAADAEKPARPARPARVGRLGAVPTVIAGVATLLLAMLVGVLIGHNTGSNSARTIASAPVRVITVGNGGSSSSAGVGSSSGGSAATGKSSGKASKSAKTTVKPKKVTKAAAKQTVKKESNAASKVLGGSGTPAATVTVGQTGTGKGFNKKTHKFDGTFFGQ